MDGDVPTTNPYPRFVNVLAEWDKRRFRVGITEDEVCKQAHIEVATMKRWRKGLLTPRVDTWAMMEQALDHLIERQYSAFAKQAEGGGGG